MHAWPLVGWSEMMMNSQWFGNCNKSDKENKMKNPRHQSVIIMSVAMTILLGQASFAVAQTSPYSDPMTGEPIEYIKGSLAREMRRKMQADTCPEAIDITGKTYWHPTTETGVGAVCTNSNNFPPVWKQVPLAPNIPQYLSASGAECCKNFYGRHGVPLDKCGMEDVCAEKAVVWHTSKYKATICTNSGDYPTLWNDPAVRQYHLFPTAEGCCAEVFKRTGQTCDIRDVEEPWTCDKWHLSIEVDDGGKPIDPVGTCTNTGVVEEVWIAYSQHYIFSSHTACCNKFGFTADKCYKVDTCAEPAASTPPPPTPRPTTKAPTPVPTTKAPTPVPTTKAPTPVPTTKAPTPVPTTKAPTPVPTTKPTPLPSKSPTTEPTRLPTRSPSVSPTKLPTHSPSDSPTKPSITTTGGDMVQNSDVLCPALFQPVCGEDGISYSNDCEAKRVNANIAYSGECVGECSPGGRCSTEGSSCSKGTVTCCGQTYDALNCDCEGGSWMCISNDVCMFSSCSSSKAPTKQPTPLRSQIPTKLPTKLPTTGDMEQNSDPLSSTSTTTTATTTTTSATSTSTTSASTIISSKEGKWFPATVDGKKICQYGVDYPPLYAELGFLYEDDVDENGVIIKSGEQKCCDKYMLQCRLKFIEKEDMWYPTTSSVTGERVCDYGNDYPSYYSTSSGLLFLNETACCMEFELLHCIPKEPKWFPAFADDGSKACIYDVPPSELSPGLQYSERDDCCANFPEACPTTTLPTTTTPRPAVQAPPCEVLDGKECAWWPELAFVGGRSIMYCQYSSSWPKEASDHLSPDDDGNGYYACCDKYLCTKNEDGSFVDINKARADAPTDAPTPLPSKASTTCSPGGVCSTEGSSCSKGTVSCCGQTYDALNCDCEGGSWMCIINDVCMFPSCSSSKAPTKQPTTGDMEQNSDPLSSTSTTTTATTTTTTSATSTSTTSATTTTTKLPPTPNPTPEPSPKPTPRPSSSPTPEPSPKPTPRPSSSPTPRPFSSPTPAPTTSNQGDMEQNSGSLKDCSSYRKRPCYRAKEQGCLWGGPGRRCYHEDDEMIPNSDFAGICSQHNRKRGKCQQAGCTWVEGKSREGKEKCVPNEDGSAPALVVVGKSGKK